MINKENGEWQNTLLDGHDSGNKRKYGDTWGEYSKAWLPAD